MSNLKQIPVTTSPSGLSTIHRLACIALKAKGFNPSPVDIKEELALEDENMLLQLVQDTEQVMHHHQIPFVPQAIMHKP